MTEQSNETTKDRAHCNIADVQSLGEEVRNQPTKRFAFLFLAPFEIAQNRRVNIDCDPWHDELMIKFFASDVKSREMFDN